MKEEPWYGLPMVMYGVQDFRRHHEPLGPKYGIGVVGVMPFEFIPMEGKGFQIIRNFLPEEDALAERFVYREEHVDWRWAQRNGDATVKIARGMMETPGLRWLFIRSWGLMAYGWPEMQEYFPGILDKMQTVLTEVCGDMAFVDERNISFPFGDKEKASSEFGILLPL
jgi:hypothetical protein